MAIVLKKFMLGKLSVEEAMSSQVISLSQKAAIDQCINYMIKYKVNALLMKDGEDKPSGVVSKTDIMNRGIYRNQGCVFYGTLRIEHNIVCCQYKIWYTTDFYKYFYMGSVHIHIPWIIEKCLQWG